MCGCLPRLRGNSPSSVEACGPLGQGDRKRCGVHGMVGCDVINVVLVLKWDERDRGDDACGPLGRQDCTERHWKWAAWHARFMMLHLREREWCDKLAGDHLMARAVKASKGNYCRALRSRFDEPAGILHAIQMEIRSCLDLITILRRSSVRGALLKDLCRLTKVFYNCNAEITRCMNEFAPVFLFSLGFRILVRFRAAVAGFRTRFKKRLFSI